MKQLTTAVGLTLVTRWRSNQLVHAAYVGTACEDGTIALNRTVLSLEEVRDTLRTRLRAKAKKTVFVDAHPLSLIHI